MAEPTHRNPTWVLGGVLLVLVSAIGGMLLFRAGDERRAVLVAARDIAAGEVVEIADFRTERVALDGVTAVEPADVDEIVGQRAVGPVPAGALVHPAMFSVEPGLGTDEMEIGAALDPGAFPRTDLALGATVELLVVTVSGADAGSLLPGGFAAAPSTTVAATTTTTAPTTATTTTTTTTTTPAPTSVVPATTVPIPTTTATVGPAARDEVARIASLGRGTIVAVEERATGQLLVTIRTRRSVGLYASQAAAEGRLRLAIVAPVAAEAGD